MNTSEVIKPKGVVEVIIEYKDGRPTEVREFNNTVLLGGRSALASALVNDIGDSFDFFISRMLFGSNGESGGAPKFVNSGRTGLFGVAVVNKPVVAQVDSQSSTQALFTSVVGFDDGNGNDINEIALQMNTGDLFSMVTFGSISKTSMMQITWNWRLSFV